MSFKAKTNKNTHVISVRFSPKPVPEGTRITVWEEENEWALIEVKLDGEVVTGEMPSSDYDRTP